MASLKDQLASAVANFFKPKPPTEKEIIRAGQKLIPEVKRRIFGMGLATDGKPMGKKVDGTFGHAVDTGELRDNFGTELRVVDGVLKIGWSSEELKERAGFVEEYYATKIFDLTPFEKRRLDDIMRGKKYKAPKPPQPLKKKK